MNIDYPNQIYITNGFKKNFRINKKSFQIIP